MAFPFYTQWIGDRGVPCILNLKAIITKSVLLIGLETLQEVECFLYPYVLAPLATLSAILFYVDILGIWEIAAVNDIAALCRAAQKNVLEEDNDLNVVDFSTLA